MPSTAMGAQFESMLDVTVVYPQGAPTFWEFLCGRGGGVVVRVAQVPIPAEFRSGDYAADNAYRQRFHASAEGAGPNTLSTTRAGIDPVMRRGPR